ncbi:saccharopine dehydrogenase family protein [Psychrobacter aestuarii]|uniref:Saccharopine dehydrogenase NADP-binding domain-containing protein n=1 Tax=Psychrobacter aestuarii TaxID=556327 RepID=A0ABP3FSG5_9GAMM|nr:saccharopine dehydrogenase NADP-binding domain-containing protein [Psychrobacter aestuarii]
MTSSTTAHTSEKTEPQNKTHEARYDVVLYGATSFVGQITARYLSAFLTAQPDSKARIALAGRDADNLKKLQQTLQTATDIIIADSNDTDSLATMVKQTRLIISTVGPYLRYGAPLVAACAEHGTDYIDLTGETLFIKDMMDAHGDTAKESGARIVHCCGFDSTPSDLGVYFTQARAKEAFGAVCQQIQMRVVEAKGGISGGTIASMTTLFAEASKDPKRRRQLGNPYLLNNDANPPSIKQQNVTKPRYDHEHEHWVAPFVMASINTRVVHRSNQLQDYAYGRDFLYDEATWMADGIKGQVQSYGMSAGLLGLTTALSFARSRDFLSKHILPKAGSGPSKDAQEAGHYTLRFFGQTAAGKTLTTEVTGDKDPGYGSTARMLAQSALCLLDVPKSDVGGGFWTPASAMGEALIERLEAHAGLSFHVLDA